jgi:hypothetical protein
MRTEMLKGDDKAQPCYNSPAVAGFREFPHEWHSIIKPEFRKEDDDLLVCSRCGAMLKKSPNSEKGR